MDFCATKQALTNQAHPTSQIGLDVLLREVMEALGEANVESVGEPERCLDNCPVGDTSVSRHRIKVQVAI